MLLMVVLGPKCYRLIHGDSCSHLHAVSKIKAAQDDRASTKLILIGWLGRLSSTQAEASITIWWTRSLLSTSEAAGEVSHVAMAADQWVKASMEAS